MFCMLLQEKEFIYLIKKREKKRKIELLYLPPQVTKSALQVTSPTYETHLSAWLKYYNSNLFALLQGQTSHHQYISILVQRRQGVQGRRSKGNTCSL